MNYGMGMQQPMGSEDEQALLPEYVRNEFDRRRAKDLQSRHEHPALYDQLDRIEAKLDQLLAQKRD